MTELKTDHVGMSDDDFWSEMHAVGAYREARAYLHTAMQKMQHASSLSDMKAKHLQDLIKAVTDSFDDYGVDLDAWTEQVARARKGDY